MLSLTELRRAGRILDQELRGARLARAVPHDRLGVVLVLETGGRGEPRRKHALLLSCRPRLGRVARLEEAPPAPKQLPPFCQFLRAHGVGSRLEQVRVASGDRILRLRFVGREAGFELVLALMGGRSNLYLLEAEDRLRLALRPLEQTRRDLRLGEPWRDPEPQDRPAGEDRFAAVPDREFLAALERLAREGEAAETRRDMLGTLGRLLRRRAQTLERKRTLLQGDLAAGEHAVELERMGQLLKANLHRVRKGQAEVEVDDPGRGERVAIPLDPALAPGANLEAVFRRYRKALRRASRAGDELASLEEDLARVREQLAELEILERSAPDPEALAAFAARPAIARLLARAKAPEAARPGTEARRRFGPAGVPARLLPKRYRSAAGLEIWVGKSDEGNDYLSTRLARGNDLFFHLEGSPGSHVVLRTEGRTDPPSEAVLEACELAVHFSKERGSSRCGVHVVPIKQVRKPRGAKPGLVMVHGGRTLTLRHDPARLRRILEARIPDQEPG